MHRNERTMFGRASLLAALALAPACYQSMGEPGSQTFAISPHQDAYITRVANGVVVKPLLTVGDSVNDKPDGTPYRMVGIPDGLGAFDNGDGTFTVLMNHELGPTVGVVRAHGAKGAFVSKWVVATDDFEVLDGQDLIQSVRTYDAVNGVWNAAAPGVALGRLCSADLPAGSGVWDEASALGFEGHLFFSGEETGNEGRPFVHVVDGSEAGVSYELAHLGNMSFENVVPNPGTGATTVVAEMDDQGGGQVYIYVGEKTDAGNPVERAGLADGVLYGIAVDGILTETDATVVTPGLGFTLESFGDVSAMTGAQLQTASVAAGVTAFQRPEDGAWDPTSPNDFYFVTTASFTGRTRLWRLRFDDAANPTAGGEIDLLIDGGTPRMFDNMAVSQDGRFVILQEDPGGQDHLAKVWRYEIATESLDVIAEHNEDFFAPGGSDFLTRDEESSGVIDVSDILGHGWFVIDVQAHRGIADAELVEHGQLLLMHVAPGQP